MVHASQRIAGGIRRYPWSYILSTRSDGVSRREYITCCVLITVVFCAAILTYPLAITKGKPGVLESVDMAELGIC